MSRSIIFKHLYEVPIFKAGDHSHLAEILHPKHDGFDEPFSLAYAFLEVEERTLPHKLSQSETYIILEGEGTLRCDHKDIRVKKGDIVFIPAEMKQSLTNNGKKRLEFMCLVCPPWSSEGEVILK